MQPMSDQRPSGGELDGAAELLASARARLAAAAAELSIPPAFRLTEWQRTTVARLHSELVREIEDDLRARLAEVFADEGVQAALGSAHLPLVEPILAGERRLDAPLVAALLRRAEEHRLRSAADHSLLGDLAGDEDEAVAAEAMSLLVLESGRVDAFGEPVIGRSDLPAEIRHRLAWRVAAGLRLYLVRRHCLAAGSVDSALAAAVGGLLARYDEGGGADARALRLARRLDELGRLGDALLRRLLPEAGLPLLLAALAVRTGLGPADAWALLSDRRGALLLLRASGCGRDAAASILLQIGAGEASLPDRLEAFDALAAGDAEADLAAWRADPAYRSAILEIGA